MLINGADKLSALFSDTRRSHAVAKIAENAKIAPDHFKKEFQRGNKLKSKLYFCQIEPNIFL